MTASYRSVGCNSINDLRINLQNDNTDTFNSSPSIIGKSSFINGINCGLLGRNNLLFGESCLINGKNNNMLGDNNIIGGCNNHIIGDDNKVHGRNNNVVGDNNKIYGNNNRINGNNNFIFHVNGIDSQKDDKKFHCLRQFEMFKNAYDDEECGLYDLVFDYVM
jgi:hypothetical protein